MDVVGIIIMVFALISSFSFASFMAFGQRAAVVSGTAGKVEVTSGWAVVLVPLVITIIEALAIAALAFKLTTILGIAIGPC